MNNNQVLINVLNRNTTHGLSEQEEDILLRKLVGILTESEKKVIIKRLQDEDDSKKGVIYREGNE